MYSRFAMISVLFRVSAFILSDRMSVHQYRCVNMDVGRDAFFGSRRIDTLGRVHSATFSLNRLMNSLLQRQASYRQLFPLMPMSIYYLLFVQVTF